MSLPRGRPLYWPDFGSLTLVVALVFLIVYQYFF